MIFHFPPAVKTRGSKLYLLPLCAATIFVGASVLPRPVLAQTAPRLGADYRLGVGDELQVTVSNHPDVNSSLVVRPDGKITLPRVGDLMAAGKTTAQLSVEIERILARTLNNARVQVIVQTAAPRQARIIGAVKAPNAYQVKPNSRIVDLISLAGGLNTKAERISGRVIRGGRVIPFDVRAAIANPTGKANIAIRPDDLVQLDAVEFARQLTVTGNIAAPGAFDLDENLNVTRLLALAGGTTENAALRRAHVLRGGVPIPLDLSGVESGQLGPNSPLNTFKFQAGDVLVVPENTAKIIVMGQVARPASYLLSEETARNSILNVLAQAGGPTPNANLSRVMLTRTTNGQPQTTSINVRAIRDGKAPDNVFLRADDALFVPENTAKVNVQGQVSRPSAYLLSEDATENSILKVLAQAGGPTENADLSNVSLTRVVNGEPQTTTINVRAIRDGKAPDNVILRPDDALLVPKQDATVTVSGPVGSPGERPLQEGETLLSLLLKTGTISKNAGLRNAYVLRDGEQIPVDLRPTLVEGAIDPKIAGFRLQRGDSIVIPDVSEQVVVTGAIANPGLYPLTDDLNIVSLLARAGNQTPGALLSQAFVKRGDARIPLDLTVFLSGATDRPSLTGFKLKPGDTLVIPENKVFYAVLGQVGAPGKFPYPENPGDASVLRALINAGGPASPNRAGGADLADARIARQVGGQYTTIVPVNLKDLFNSKSGTMTQNVILQPGDLLFIPAKGRGFQIGDLFTAAGVYNIFAR